MSQPSAERNLLFGILAFQLNFIDRAALLGAFDQWSSNKTQPLGQLLRERGALSAEQLQLLEALVTQYVARFNNDVGQSLAHVSALASSVRDDLQKIADPDVTASLAVVGNASADDPFLTLAGSVGETTSQGTRFRILRPHARGGLGQVSVARDEELNREVALKEIQARHADNPDSRARFLLEAEITGGLEHPSIVPVYGLGTYADGRPFYAMRFIRGDSLKEAVDRYYEPKSEKSNPGERVVELRKLLGRFLDVCNAIAYAHSRGVLHRDLKPGNVMLGQYGETLVVDWGLAKAVDRPELNSDSREGLLKPATGSGSTATQMGSALGTPQYMSPEQAAGRLDLLGPASDVYSLGATLYYVLTGHPPIEGNDLGAVLQKVQRGEFRPPRVVNQQIARPLESICLKAMALKPEDRYVSPRDLADDLEHWLADEPVASYRESWLAMLSRTLDRSQDDVKFRDWANMLFIVAGLFGGMELTVFCLTINGPPFPQKLVLLVRAAFLLSIGLVFVHFQRGRMLPANTAERLMWSTWSGCVIGSALIGVADFQLSTDHLWHDARRVYPALSILSGLSFVVMGAGYWGRCYLIALGFFMLSIVMPWTLRWVVLEYGALWTVSLLAISIHLRRAYR